MRDDMPSAVRELRSKKTARSGRLNVVDETGTLRLGAPDPVPSSELQPSEVKA